MRDCMNRSHARETMRPAGSAVTSLVRIADNATKRLK
jgi:hypothetical protein